MDIGKWKMAQTWRHFKRPASSKGMWKQFVEESKERDQMAEGGVPQLVQPGPGRQGYQGVKELPDGGYSVRSKYKADLGNWPTGEKKAKTHYFDEIEDARAFLKEAKTQPIRATESSQKVQKNRSKWVKKFYKENVDNFKVSDYDKFTKKMAKEWAKESKKGDYIDIEKRVRLTDDMGLPLVREETTIFDLTAAKKGQVETHGPSKAFYKRAFFKGKLERDKDLKKGVKKYMEWATEKRPEGAPAAYKARRTDWLKAGEDFIDKDVLYFLGEGYDQFKYGQGGGSFFDIMSKEYPELFKKYHAKVNLSKGTYEKTLKEVAELAGRDFNEVLNSIRKENQAVKTLLGIDKLPSDMVFGYSGEHVGGLKTAIINNDKAFANKVLDNVIASTRGRNTELGWKLLEKPKNRLVREFKKAKTLDAKSKIITRLNDLVQKVDPGSVEWKINKGKLDFKPLIKQATLEQKASGYLSQKGVRKFLLDAGFPVKKCFSEGGRVSLQGGGGPNQCIRGAINDTIQKAKQGDKAALQILENQKQVLKQSVKKGTGLASKLSWILGPLDIPIELSFALPHLLMGDFDAAKRATTGGWAGWGEIDLDNVDDPEARKYMKHVRDTENWMNNWQKHDYYTNKLENLPDDASRALRNTVEAEVNKRASNMDSIAQNYDGYDRSSSENEDWVYHPEEMAGKKAARTWIDTKVETDLDTQLDKTYGESEIMGVPIDLSPYKKEAKEKLRASPKDLESFIETKGQDFYGDPEGWWFYRPLKQEEAEAHGVGNIYDDYYMGASEGKDIRDAYSSIPLDYASQLGALEAKEARAREGLEPYRRRNQNPLNEMYYNRGGRVSYLDGGIVSLLKKK